VIAACVHSGDAGIARYRLRRELYSDNGERQEEAVTSVGKMQDTGIRGAFVASRDIHASQLD
jgi:hypothetical protein